MAKAIIFQTSYGYGMTSEENATAYAMDENAVVKFEKGQGFDTFEDVANYAMNFLGIARTDIRFTFI